MAGSARRWQVTPAQPTAEGCHSSNVRRSRILAHRQVADGTFRLRVACPEIAATAVPGQFVMVRLPGRNDPLLARPLAVYDTFPADGDTPASFDLIYVVHGRFTRSLCSEAAGADVAVWGPLGNGFSPPAVDHLVLVAGGIGQTALLALGKERLGAATYGASPRSIAKAKRVSFLWGARTAGAFSDLRDFESAGMETHLATMDGSAGHHGTVVDLLDACVANDPDGFRSGSAAIACCGPEPMMEAVAAWCERHQLPCQVSLETPMACGIGICFTCVAAVRDPDGGWDYRRTCIEGPVFDAETLVWHPSDADVIA
jgi:dihydroorotate dehydrogenase electron transfer subunit